MRMNKSITLFVAAGLAMALPVAASQIYLDWNTPVKTSGIEKVSKNKAASKYHKAPAADDMYDYEILMTEDFSKMTEGSVGAPAAEYIDAEDHSIPDKYFSTPGWSGFRVKQAGGAAYVQTINESEEEGMYNPVGEIMTSEIEVNTNGVTTVTVCARVKSEVPDNQLIIIPLAHSYSGALGIMNADDISEEWTDMEFEIDLPESYTSYNEETEEYDNNMLTTCVFKLSGSTGAIYLDEVSLVKKTPKVGIPQNLGYTGFTADGFTAVWDAVEGADKYIVNASYVETTMEKEIRTPIFTAKEVNGTSLDIVASTEGTIAFDVQAVKGDMLSPVSEELRVFDVVAPVMEPASGITATRFTAAWKPVKGASAYEVWAHKGFTADKDVKGYELAHLDFTGMTDQGEDYEAEENLWLDDYATGWMARYYATPADGGLLMDNSAAMYGMQSCFMSCEYDLSNADGKVNVSITAKSDAGMTILVAMGAPNAFGGYDTADTEEIVLSNEMKTYTATLEGGKEGCLIGIYMGDYNDMLVADIAVTQDLKAGETIYTPYAFEATETETSAAMLFPEGEFGRVKCAARAYKYEYMEAFGMMFVINSAVSAFSEPVYVEPQGSTGILEIGGNTNAKAIYYNLQGIKCDSRNLLPGMYIRRSGTTTEKVLVR